MTGLNPRPVRHDFNALQVLAPGHANLPWNATTDPQISEAQAHVRAATTGPSHHVRKDRLMTVSTSRARAYSFSTTVPAPYQQAIAQTKAALKEQGFGVLTEIDVQQTLKDKLDAEFRHYVILGACNPTLAHRALQADLGIGLLLPCNVVVYDNGDGSSSVEAIDPEAALGIVGHDPAVSEVAREASACLRRAVNALGSPEGKRGPAGGQAR